LEFPTHLVGNSQTHYEDTKGAKIKADTETARAQEFQEATFRRVLRAFELGLVCVSRRNCFKGQAKLPGQGVVLTLLCNRKLGH